MFWAVPDKNNYAYFNTILYRLYPTPGFYYSILKEESDYCSILLYDYFNYIDLSTAIREIWPYLSQEQKDEIMPKILGRK